MAESTLSLSLPDFEQEAGFFLGYGRGAKANQTAWTASQQTSISNCIDAALRMFYRPMPTDPSQSSYKWSFLYPSATLTLASGANTVALPDDFGNFDGNLVLGGDNAGWTTVRLTGSGVVDSYYSNTPDMTGQPWLACERPLKGTSLTEGQRKELYVYPTADAAYTLNCRYYVLLDRLTTARPHPYGGMAHSETIRAAVRASAELMLDGIRGPEYQYYMEQLMASISYDRGSNPKLIGYNGDNSDNIYRGGSHWQNTRVTINGSVPT